MDLREGQLQGATRHPWELARVSALRAISRHYGLIPSPGLNVLDLGCGDGFTINGLTVDQEVRIDGVDVHLSDAHLCDLHRLYPRMVPHRSCAALTGRRYGLITLFDVLEHLPDDVSCVRDIATRFTAPGGRLFFTVPAFQCLFGTHDTFLQHHRRYSRGTLLQVLNQAGLRVLGSGYLFGLLLPLRALAVAGQHLLGRPGPGPQGVGAWRQGRLLTWMATTLLSMDNRLLLWLSSRGISLPGLTVWAVCEIAQ